MTYLAIGCLVALLLAYILGDRPEERDARDKAAEFVIALMIIIPLAVLVADVC
ncbi:hypothetical protein P9429_11640 [Bacillus atrophaeus]|uniref:hypothetical protein n=1 Tax=Bacillus atrophaeus TaxID=1452 RepID=UPI002E245A02|nr:hypothetical protein [Bacillus atrophaeus]